MRRFYMSISAANGNIGDIFIRRAVLNQLRALGLESVVFKGSMTDGYVDAFGFDSADTVVASPFAFVYSLLRDVLSVRRPVVVMAPGPIAVGASILTTLKHALLIVLLGAVRVLGGRVLTLGRSVDVVRKYGLPIERALAIVSDIYVARDSRTARIVGKRALLFPDFAFCGADVGAEVSGTHSAAPRTLMVISLRHDRIREEDRSAVQELRQFAGRSDLDLVFAVQVQEDSEENQRLADAVDAPCCEWTEELAHSDQERLVTELYSRAAVVVSDRLHVLILAARNGAIPVVYQRDGVTKIQDALDHLLAPQSISSNSAGNGVVVDGSERARIRSGVSCASSLMDELESRLSRILLEASS